MEGLVVAATQNKHDMVLSYHSREMKGRMGEHYQHVGGEEEANNMEEYERRWKSFPSSSFDGFRLTSS